MLLDRTLAQGLDVHDPALPQLPELDGVSQLHPLVEGDAGIQTDVCLLAWWIFHGWCIGTGLSETQASVKTWMRKTVRPRWTPQWTR